MAFNRCRAGTATEDGRPAQARLAAILMLIVSFFGVASVAQPMTAWAVSSDAQQLLNLINQDRAAVGVQPLTLREDLVQIAADHSAWMASTGTFQHRADLSAGVTGPWTRIGENIAYGWSVSNIHHMFMESEGHCKNNLYSGFNRIGVEFATGGNGAKYVTVVFVQESGASLPATTLCPYDYSATTTTTVPPATTTTTVPPATTTTTVPPATTTTTAPPTSSTTVPLAVTTNSPSTTSTTAATEVLLQLSTTTTTLVSQGTEAREIETGGGTVAAAVPFDSAASDDATALPVVPLAGGALAVTAAGAWWLVAAKRAASRVAAPATWGIPHSGVRPPQ